MTRIFAPLLALSVSLSASPAMAHPGDHAIFSAAALAEHLLEPDHLVFIALVVLVAILAYRVGRRAEARQRRKP
jgi:hydrogenase/urease accessory protein HupE